MYFIIADLYSCHKCVRDKLFTCYCVVAHLQQASKWAIYFAVIIDTLAICRASACDVLHMWPGSSAASQYLDSHKWASQIADYCSFFNCELGLAESDAQCLLWVINNSKLSFPIKPKGTARNGEVIKCALTSMFVFPSGAICQIGQTFQYCPSFEAFSFKFFAGPQWTGFIRKFLQFCFLQVFDIQCFPVSADHINVFENREHCKAFSKYKTF